LIGPHGNWIVAVLVVTPVGSAEVTIAVTIMYFSTHGFIATSLYEIPLATHGTIDPS
jgi:hypothetical protein